MAYSGIVCTYVAMCSQHTAVHAKCKCYYIKPKPFNCLFLLQGEFQLSKFQDGVLPAAFMVGVLVASLLFSELCKHYNAFRLIGRLPSKHLNTQGVCQRHE